MFLLNPNPHGTVDRIAPNHCSQQAKVLWQLKPDLVVEIGTECGGSAIFMGMHLKMIGKGKLVTYDFLPVVDRQCESPRGFDSPLWPELQASGILESRVADVTLPTELAYVRSLANKSKTVVVIEGHP